MGVTFHSLSSISVSDVLYFPTLLALRLLDNCDCIADIYLSIGEVVINTSGTLESEEHAAKRRERVRQQVKTAYDSFFHTCRNANVFKNFIVQVK